MSAYDVTIIGGGPGGYVAALRAASEGLKVALIEASALGGTCLNTGCIPSKTYLKNAEIIEEVRNGKARGISADNVTVSLASLVTYKNRVLKNLNTGIASLLKRKKVDIFKGFGEVQSANEIIIKTEDSTETITTKYMVVATGSKPAIPPIPGLDNVDYYTTDTIFDMQNIPSSLTIIGGGVIGVELAEVFNAFGTNVTIVEASERLIPMEDEEASQLLQTYLEKKGIQVFTNTLLKQVEQHADQKVLHVQSQNEMLTLETQQLLMAVGRKPNLSANQAFPLEQDGPFLKVNAHLQTSVPTIYAIGDVIGGYQLAHVASAEGLNCIDNILGHVKKMDYSVIPRCIYTNLQIASVGATEVDLKTQQIAYKVTKYPFSALGKSQTLGKSDGFIKLFTDVTYGEILGICLVGHTVTELIGQGSAYMQLEGTVVELAEMVQPHPSLSEIFMEVSNLAIGKGVH
ncbi:MAG TPA: dihydrolipoyl dehydrogenase [Metalysinibacillus sp.]